MCGLSVGDWGILLLVDERLVAVEQARLSPPSWSNLHLACAKAAQSACVPLGTVWKEGYHIPPGAPLCVGCLHLARCCRRGEPLRLECTDHKAARGLPLWMLSCS